MLNISEPGQDKNRQVIGIDLGTTYSLVAYAENGNVSFVPLNGENASLPSMVGYHTSTDKFYGQEAFDALRQGHQNIFYSMKRLMGKGLQDVQSFKEHVPFEVAGDDEQVKAVYNDIEKSAIEVSADLLNYMKVKAEKHLNSAVYDAVITVPAYFNDAERQTTKDAAKLAGLNVLRLISEPTAAALAYGLNNKAQGMFLVYDLGGGTFDVSLLKLTDGIFRVLATGGNTYLGGDDIDVLIAKSLNISAVEARILKEKVSKGETIPELTAGRLAELAKPLIDETLQICENVLDDAEIDVDNLTGIVLVGGSTKLVTVQTAVENYFGKTVEKGINPDQVVAHGAALQAASLSGVSRDDMLLLDVTPLSLGLETVGGLVEKVIERNTPIPITKAQKFTTFKDNQTAMDIHVLQGERETVESCRSLAKFRLSGIPPMAAGAARIVVMFALDADGLLTISAKEESTGVIQSIDVVPSYGMKPEVMLDMLKDSFAHAKDDVMWRQLREAQLELERVIDACSSALEKDSSMLQVDEVDKLEKALQQARNYLTSKLRDDVENAMEALESTFQTFSEARVNHALRTAIVGRNIHSETESK